MTERAAYRPVTGFDLDSQFRLPAAVARAIAQHAAAAYPDECCGALLGHEGGVVEVFALPNGMAESRGRRFLVGPDEYVAAESHGQARGLDLVGFYHSHPDHPARPSMYDRDHAWPTFAYVIVSVERGAVTACTGWRLRPDRSGFDEILLVEQ
jgi:proteasome lid subunit RPN8/RPN11